MVFENVRHNYPSLFSFSASGKSVTFQTISTLEETESGMGSFSFLLVDLGYLFSRIA